ncbi:MAG TPA: hypothetical protein VMV69_19880 [Pirellulales bacterium]|nr:hypothetical protein [Pirellulales bacterium]
MTQVIVDATLKRKLLNLTRKLEFRSASGEVLGTFVPTVDYEQVERAMPKLSEEEMRRREKETGGYTTAEVLAYLEKL